MRKTFHVIAVTVLMLCVGGLGGCQTAGTLDDAFIDKYDFSSSTRTWLRKYAKMQDAKLMTVSKTKGELNYWYYVELPNPVGLQGKALASCETDSGEECVVLAIGNGLTTRGLAVIEAVYGESVGTTSTSTTTFTTSDFLAWSDHRLCNLVTTKSKPYEWQAHTSYKSEVSEAKNRSLTPDKCAEILDLDSTVGNTATVTAPATTDTETLESKLAAIKSLLDKGLITEDEAAQKRLKLLDAY